ncbi:MAG: tetratricopeptide repeat protein [Pirellulales bacterium]|nr:tetratricopeptide repeat protein [Pirellulales bacterium]
MLEGLFWLLGVESVIEKEDPFRGFSKLVKVFQVDGGKYRTRQDSSHRTFNAQSFTADKSENGFRFFTLGGSSSYGYPRGAEVAFPAILTELLAESHPEILVEGVNASGISYGMHRLNIVAEELVQYDPDLLIVYSGHNEFIEPEFFESLKNRGVAREGLEYTLAQSRLYSLMRSAIDQVRATESTEGLGVGRQVRRDQTQVYTPEEKAEIVASYRRGLMRLVDLAQAAGVRVLLATIPANLRGWRPEASTGSGKNHRRWVEAQARGRNLLKQDEYKQALIALQEAVRLEPGHAESQFDLGRCYEQLGEWDKAKQAYQDACNNDASPVRRIEAINQAIRDVAREKETLFVDADKLFEQQSEHGLVGYRLIEDYVHPTLEGHEEIAREVWKVIEQAGLLGKNNEVDQTVFERVITARRELEIEKDMPWFYNQGVVLENQGQIEAALENFRKVVEMAPTNETALLNIGKALTKHGKAQEAVPILRQVCKLAPENPETHVSLGTALLDMGDIQGAVLELEKGIARKPDYPNAHNSLGAAFARSGDLVQAVKEFQLAVAQNPDHAAAHNNLGSALAQQGKWKEAALAHRKALQINPAYANAAENLATAFLAINLPDQAIEQYEIALKIAPESHKTRQRQIAILCDRGLIAAAIGHLRILLEQTPKDLNACTKLGDLYLQIGDYQQSLRLRKLAYEMAPERVDSLNNLAWLLATTPYPNDRDGKKALQLAESAATATEYKSAGVLDTLAAAWAATGNFTEAVETQEKAIVLAPEQEQVRFKHRLDLYRQQKPYRLAEDPDGASQ